MFTCCINCRRYIMESGTVWSEYTEESESVACGAHHYNFRLREADAIIEKQREVMRLGCADFAPYNTEETR